MNNREQEHDRAMTEFVIHPLSKVKDIIVFCNPKIDRSKLKVFYPNKNVKGVDVCYNLFQFWKPDMVYESDEEFIKGLRMFIPAKNMDIDNGFLNITFRDELYTKEIVRLASLLSLDTP